MCARYRSVLLLTILCENLNMWFILKKHGNVFRCPNDLVCTHNNVILSADWLWLCFGWIISPENGVCLSLNSIYLYLLNSLVLFKGERCFVHFVKQCNLPQTALLLTSSAAGFYVLFEQEKHLILVRLPFHNSLFQNGTWDFPNMNLVQIREYSCMCCMLQQYLLMALCQ